MRNKTRHFAQSLKSKENKCDVIRCVSKESGRSANIPEKVMFKKDSSGKNMYLCANGRFEFTEGHKNYDLFLQYEEDHDNYFSVENRKIWSKENRDRLDNHPLVQSIMIEMMSSDLDEGELQPYKSIFDHKSKNGLRVETKAGGGSE